MAHAKAKRMGGNTAGVCQGLLFLDICLGSPSTKYLEGDCPAANRASRPGHAAPCRWPHARHGPGHVPTVCIWTAPSSERPVCRAPRVFGVDHRNAVKGGQGFQLDSTEFGTLSPNMFFYSVSCNHHHCALPFLGSRARVMPGRWMYVMFGCQLTCGTVVSVSFFVHRCHHGIHQVAVAASSVPGGNALVGLLHDLFAAAPAATAFPLHAAKQRVQTASSNQRPSLCRLEL